MNDEIPASVGMVRRLGLITVIGLTGREGIAFPWDAAIWKVCAIISNLTTGFTCWDRAIGLIGSKKLDVAEIITKGGKR